MITNTVQTSSSVQKKAIKFLTSFNLTRYHSKKYVSAFLQVKTVLTVVIYL